MYEIGKRIKKVREDKGISQKDFAISVGVGNTTVLRQNKNRYKLNGHAVSLVVTHARFERATP